MLNTVHDEGPIRIVLESNKAFQAQQLRASHGLEQLDECGEISCRYRAPFQQRQALDAGRGMAARAGDIVLRLLLLDQRLLESQPSFNIGSLLGGNVVAWLKHRGKVEFSPVTIHNRSRRIDLADLLQQIGNRAAFGRFCANICLGEHDGIRKRDLLHAFEVPLHRVFDRGRIDGADDAGQSEASGDDMIPKPGCRKPARRDLIDDRSGIGQPGGLDDHALERRDSLAFHSIVEFEQGRPDVARGRAAEAARGRHHHLALVHADEIMVD